MGGKYAVPGDACELCPRTARHWDHHHQTGKVRGRLCPACNHKMAALDDEGWLERALVYRQSDGFPWNWKQLSAARDAAYGRAAWRNPAQAERLRATARRAYHKAKARKAAA